jgi:hypothetical protein
VAMTKIQPLVIAFTAMVVLAFALYSRQQPTTTAPQQSSGDPRYLPSSTHAMDYDETLREALRQYVARCAPDLSSQGLPADKAQAACSCVFAGAVKAMQIGTEGDKQRFAALMAAQPNPQGSAVDRQLYGIVSGCFPH